jgi:peptidoglycan/LPS O-acetylase OafA/YrhL
MRLVALDSLRGIAALSVVIYHSMLVSPRLHGFLDGRGVPYAVTGDVTALVLTVTPPSLLWSGREAVLLFFVLSGFVLALPFMEEGRRPPGYPAFAMKRAVRLLLPCAAVALLVAALVPLVGPRPRPEWSGWVNGAWAEELTPGLVLGHAMLLLDGYSLNSPMWTLHYELLISLLFPLLVLLSKAGAAVLGVAAAAGVFVCLAEMKFFGTGALTTLLFVPHFALGAMLARHRREVAAGVAGLGASARTGLWLVCYTLLSFRWLAPADGLVCDLVNGAGAALLIALVLGSRRVQAALRAGPWPWLGAISYSLYLVHVPVLLTALHLAPAGAPVASLLVAAVLHRLVERPSIGLGRRAASWVEARTRRARD